MESTCTSLLYFNNIVKMSLCVCEKQQIYWERIVCWKIRCKSKWGKSQILRWYILLFCNRTARKENWMNISVVIDLVCTLSGALFAHLLGHLYKYIASYNRVDQPSFLLSENIASWQKRRCSSNWIEIVEVCHQVSIENITYVHIVSIYRLHPNTY